MSAKNSLNIQEMNLKKQLKQYSLSLQQIMIQLNNSCNYIRLSSTIRNNNNNNNSWGIKQLQIMAQKIKLQLQQYGQTVTKLENKIMGVGAIKNIRNYFNNNFSTLIRQSHQLISMCCNKVKLPKDQDYQRVKQLQQELDYQWENNRNYDQNKWNSTKTRSKSINKNKIYKGTIQKQNENTQNLTLEQRANAQIQQQFLAIRLIAYKMYQKYNNHNHQKIFEQMQTLKAEQDKLFKEINDMKQVRMSLLSQQRKLQAQLNQVKKINQLIGRRYFIQGNPDQTNFTTN